jgi:hypothetical protein
MSTEKPNGKTQAQNPAAIRGTGWFAISFEAIWGLSLHCQKRGPL